MEYGQLYWEAEHNLNSPHSQGASDRMISDRHVRCGLGSGCFVKFIEAFNIQTLIVDVAFKNKPKLGSAKALGDSIWFMICVEVGINYQVSIC